MAVEAAFPRVHGSLAKNGRSPYFGPRGLFYLQAFDEATPPPPVCEISPGKPRKTTGTLRQVVFSLSVLSTQHGTEPEELTRNVEASEWSVSLSVLSTQPPRQSSHQVVGVVSAAEASRNGQPAC